MVIPQAVLAQIKNLVNKQTFKDVALLLEPCCAPILFITDNIDCNGSETVFTDVSITYLQAASKTTTLVFTFTNSVNGTIQVVQTATFNASGVWTGSVDTKTYFEDDISNVTVSVIINGSKVVLTSNTISLLDISNCD